MTECVGPKLVMPVHKWSITQKLELLRCYLGHNDGFLKATTKAGERYYLDLFAGPGQVSEDDSRTVADGSPLISFAAGPPPFSRLHWVEQDARYAASLRAHRQDAPHRLISIYEGDANREIDRVLANVPRTFPVFAFLDPRGAELRWATIEKLARHKSPNSPKVELLILFPYNMAIARLMPKNADRMVNQDALDRFMPDPVGWRRVYDKRPAVNSQDYRRAVLEEYVRGLTEILGYTYVPAPYLVRTPGGRALYFLIFASDHEAGWKIMTWCLGHLPDTGGQLSFGGLPGPILGDGTCPEAISDLLLLRICLSSRPMRP